VEFLLYPLHSVLLGSEHLVLEFGSEQHSWR
jgi:hypothetical protein